MEPSRSEKFKQTKPTVKGKFFFAGGEKLYVRGVTYGPFRPDEEGNLYGSVETVDRDFAAMAARGVNSVRTYTVPPGWLLDLALRHGLWVMIGLPWEQHVTFLDDPKRVHRILGFVRSAVRTWADHPAVLCFAIGNEIPSSIVRWYGRKRMERFLHKLYKATKDESRDSLVTYVNYPTTEYLHLSFLDFVCFNVFLESQDRLEAYLARLQNIADERPLVLTEVGLDSRRNGETEQARTLDWQVRTAFNSGAAGVFVFSWTDEWHRGGHDIEDWDFGLTKRDREAKPALAGVENAFHEVPFPGRPDWPHISVIVCTHNGNGTIGECLEHLRGLDYPNYEILVVDDGSKHPIGLDPLDSRVRLLRVENGGLSRARNTGLDAARGEIVAYIDDDAYPDPHWLVYLAHMFMTTDFAAVGGPNLAPPSHGLVEEAVTKSPGGPTHVLLSDREAEHIPGCNMAFRRAALQAIGGFDPQFRTAGDDVDVCWRLQKMGWRVGFQPAAVVWHHRRKSMRAFWKQQKGYGEAETLLEKKWPEKYNVAGHPIWRGRVYGGTVARAIGSRSRVYHGTWGAAAYQSLCEDPPSLLATLPSLPEWYLLIVSLVILAAIGLVWSPFMMAAPLVVFSALMPLVQAVRSSWRLCPRDPSESLSRHWFQRGLVATLHVLQPVARLWGRLKHGITPWRVRGVRGFTLPWPQEVTLWSERWWSAESRLRAIEDSLGLYGATVLRGNEFDRWDLEVQGGMLGAARLRMVIEEHGAGRQLMRFRVYPRASRLGLALAAMFGAFAILAAYDHATLATTFLGCLTALFMGRCLLDPCIGMASMRHAIQERAEESDGALRPGRAATTEAAAARNGVGQTPGKIPVAAAKTAEAVAGRAAPASRHLTRSNGSAPLDATVGLPSGAAQANGVTSDKRTARG